MAGLIQSLETAKLTLINTQMQIQTANHNISRAEDKNYHRQSVKLITNPPVMFGRFYLGIGARVQNIIQNWDFLMEQKLFNGISLEKDYATRSSYLELVTAYLKDDGEMGLSGALKAFWNSWEDFDANPEGSAEKQNIVETARRLASMIRESYSQLNELDGNIDKDINDTTNRINYLLNQIAEYNIRIRLAEGTGAQANDLRDQRYNLIKELSEYIPLKIETPDDWKTITIKVDDTLWGGSIDLVDINGALPVTVTYGAGVLTISNGSGSVTTDKGGKLAGLAQAKFEVEKQMANLDTFSGALHSNVVFNGIPVFSSGSASSIDVSITTSDLTMTANNSTTPTQAQLISRLQNTPIGALGNLTFSEYLEKLQSDLGTVTQSAKDGQEFYETLKGSIEQKQQSISGVSIDEELVEMIKFQHIFQAASKVIQTASQLLNTVINMV